MQIFWGITMKLTKREIKKHEAWKKAFNRITENLKDNSKNHNVFELSDYKYREGRKSKLA